MFKSAFDKQQSVFCDTSTVFGALAHYARLYQNAKNAISDAIEHEYSAQVNDYVSAAHEYHRVYCKRGTIHILNEHLTAAAQNAKGFIGRTHMPVLQGFHLSTNVKPGYLAIEATDLEKTYREYVQVFNRSHVETVVNDGKRFAEYMALCSNEGSRLYQNHAGLSVMDSCNYRATFKTIDSSEFPVLSAMPEQTLCTFDDVKAFKTALKVAIAGTAKDDKRPTLLFDFKPTLTLVAADGYKLTTRDLPVEGTAAQQVIIPANSLTQVVRAFTDDEPITLAIDTTGKDQRVYFAQGDREIITTIIDGKFPDYASILPKTIAYHIRFDLDELLATLKTLKAATDKDHPAIALTTGNDAGDSVRIVYLRCNGQESQLLIGGNEPGDWFTATLDLYLDIYRLYTVLNDLAKVTPKPKNVRPTKAQLKRGIFPVQQAFRYVDFGIALPQKSAVLTLTHGGQSAALMPMSRPEESFKSVLGHDYPNARQDYRSEDQKQESDQRQADSDYREWKRNRPAYAITYEVRDRSDLEFRNGKSIWFDRLSRLRPD